MKTVDNREVQRVLVKILRALRNWDQSELAAAAGVDAAAISRYESGDTTPRRATVERLAVAGGLPMLAVDTILVPAIRQALTLLRESAKRTSAGASTGRATEAEGDAALESALHEAVASALERGAAELGRLRAERVGAAARPCAADRIEAAAAWERLAPRSARERRWLVERLPELQVWGLAERLWCASVEAAADDAGTALELAQLGLRVAELGAGEAKWKKGLQALSRGFVGNALRVAGELRAAEAEFAAARELQQQAAGGDRDGLLDAWRLDDLEASLRRDQRNLGAALDLLARAESAAPAGARGRIRLKRATVLELAGDLPAAAAALRQAAPLLAASGDERLRLSAEFNTVAILRRMGRYSEAEVKLPVLRALALSLGNQLDILRVSWLHGRVAVGLGRRDEARAIFEATLKEFADRDLACDAALVALDLAVLHLEEGRTAEVREMTASIAWVLTRQDIKPEAVAALRLFWTAAQVERATVEQAQTALAALEAG